MLGVSIATIAVDCVCERVMALGDFVIGWPSRTVVVGMVFVGIGSEVDGWRIAGLAIVNSDGSTDNAETVMFN